MRDRPFLRRPIAHRNADPDQDQEDNVNDLEDLDPKEAKAVVSFSLINVNPQLTVAQKLRNRATRIIKDLEDNTIHFDRLLERCMSTSDRTSQKAVNQALSQLFQIPIRLSKPRVQHFLRANHFEVGLIQDNLSLYQDAEGISDNIQRLQKMGEVCTCPPTLYVLPHRPRP